MWLSPGVSGRLPRYVSASLLYLAVLHHLQSWLHQELGQLFEDGRKQQQCLVPSSQRYFGPNESLFQLDGVLCDTITQAQWGGPASNGPGGQQCSWRVGGQPLYGHWP